MYNFKIIYKILNYLEAAMDKSLPCDGVDLETIKPDNLGVSVNRLLHLMQMLEDDGLVKIIDDGATLQGITLKGLEYLESSTMMISAKDRLYYEERTTKTST